jgi:RimJ/RimL family protein N-acetyltransferase
LTPADADELLRGLADAQLSRDAGMPTQDHTTDTVREQIERTRPAQMRSGEAAELAIADAKTDAFLGSIMLHGVRWRSEQAEIGYWVLPDARGRGAAARAVGLLTRWAVEELGLTRIEAYVPMDNEASLRTIERGGYTREGIARAAFDNQRDRLDLAQFSFVRSDLAPRRRRAKREGDER